eukprot:GHVL01014498.1.p2 GENE.GHVL01014498.1~~GHVL01014498.1.p2  ORF type:complete len:253 (+),score=46.48 GHVL01014498.1:1174-1932(+)
MDHTKKMILIEPRVLASLRDSAGGPPVPDATSQSLKDMDQVMRGILDEKDVDKHEKADSYQQVLWRFLKRVEEYKNKPLGRVEIAQPSKQPLTEVNEVEKAQDLSRVEKRVLESVPKTLKKKAQLLLDITKDSSDIKWNEQGQLVYQGQTVAGTNMADLVNDALRYRKNAPDPQGWEVFARGLKAVNIPRELIGHTGRWEWMHSEGGDRGRPPTRTKRRRRRIVSPSSASPSAERVSFPSPPPKKTTWLSYS